MPICLAPNEFPSGRPQCSQKFLRMKMSALGYIWWRRRHQQSDWSQSDGGRWVAPRSYYYKYNTFSSSTNLLILNKLLIVFHCLHVSAIQASSRILKGTGLDAYWWPILYLKISFNYETCATLFSYIVNSENILQNSIILTPFVSWRLNTIKF